MKWSHLIRDMNEGTECPFLRKRVPSQSSSRYKDPEVGGGLACSEIGKVEGMASVQ